MGIFSFNSRTKHRKFEYIPRYYDPVKEELKERLGQYEGDEDNPEMVKRRIRSGLRRKYRSDSTVNKNALKQRNIRLIVIIFILSAIAYVFLRSDVITRLLQDL